MAIRTSLTGWDRDLIPIIEAGAEAERLQALGTLIDETARPLIFRIVQRMRGPALRSEDAEDIASVVALRLVQRLTGAETDAPIASFNDFVARLTYNAAYDILRTRFPQRTRLRNRFRYVLRHDPRFTAATIDGAIVVGLSRWSAELRQASIGPIDFKPLTTQRGKTADVLEAALAAIGRPSRLDDLVRLFAEAWGIADAGASDVVDVEPASDSDPHEELATRRRIAALWNEIAQLPPNQRAALLLNLRDRDGLNAAALLILTGVTTIDALASAVGLTSEGLWEIWNELPLDDLRIASILRLTRQQVINLRKAARERLARRMRQ